VLCRCTGYRKIVEAVLDAAGTGGAARLDADGGVGARIAKVDGVAKLTGAEDYGADEWPEDALVLRALRSPHAAARFEVGDLAPLHARFPGLVRVFAAKDVPGPNAFGIYPVGKDQPVLADGEVRYRGEAVLALVGDAAPSDRGAGGQSRLSRRRRADRGDRRGDAAGPGPRRRPAPRPLSALA